MTANDILNFGKKEVENKIISVLSLPSCEYSAVIDAMNYSALAGGKRLRPALLLEFYRLCGGKSVSDAVNFATALEFIHTYSLIHDDLPCMDNDDMRRGRPSCHIKFGEDTALLAGDALLTLAFKIASECKNTDSKLVCKAISCLAENAGVHGMIGGQVIDLAIENTNPPLSVICDMYSRKTGALIRSAAQIGCILANADNEKYEVALKFTNNIGFAFQIVDDILDITSTAEELGKPVGSDEKNNKSTYVSVVGVEKAKEEVKNLTKEAINALSVFGKESDGLCELANILTVRCN